MALVDASLTSIEQETKPNGASGRHGSETARATPGVSAGELRTPLAMLQSAAEKGRRANFDWSKVTQELAQLRQLSDQFHGLARSDQPTRRQPADGDRKSFDLSGLLHEATGLVLPMANALGREIALDAPRDVMIGGSGDDLRDIIRSLLENALTCGTGPVSVRLRVENKSGNCAGSTTEVSSESLDVPDALRRRISNAVCARGGATYFVSETTGFRVRLVLPLLTDAVELPTCASSELQFAG